MFTIIAKTEYSSALSHVCSLSLVNSLNLKFKFKEFGGTVTGHKDKQNVWSSDKLLMLSVEETSSLEEEGVANVLDDEKHNTFLHRVLREHHL